MPSYHNLKNENEFKESPSSSLSPGEARPAEHRSDGGWGEV